VTLGGLGAADVAALADGLGAELPAAEVRMVAQRTEGNPFFVEELLRQHRAGGPLAVPESVKDLVERRLRSLSESARQLLSIAAVMGREFDLATLEQVTGQDAELLLDAIEEASSAHVLVELSGEIGRFAFAHALIHETVYAQPSATRRARIHLRVAEALEQRHADRLDEHADQLARHFVAAGDERRSLGYLIRAAGAASRVYAVDAALAHQQAALELAARLGVSPDTDGRLRRVLLERGWMRQVRGDYAEGVADYGRALDAARGAGDRQLQAEALDSLAFAEKHFDVARSVTHHEEALAIAQELGDVALQIRTLSRVALTRAHNLDLPGAVEAGERAMALATETGDDRDRALAMDAQKLAALQLGDVDRLAKLTAELEVIQRARGDLWYLQWTVLESAFVPLARADWERAAARLQEAHAVHRRVGDAFCIPMIHDASCWLARSHGDLETALAEGRRAVELTERAGPTEWGGWTRATLGWALLDLRAAEDAVPVLEQALAAASTRGDRFRAAGHLAWAQVLAGDGTRADAAAREAHDALGGLRAPADGIFMFGFGATTALARAHLAAGRAERGEALLAPLLAVAARSGWHEATALVSLVLGLCCEADTDRARTLLLAAVELADRHGLAGVGWEACAALSRVTDAEEASRLRAESSRLVRRLAASAGDHRLAASLLRRADG
jgi:tetratricopeptide (TPR) repeat protein